MNIRKTVDSSAMFAALEAVMEADLPQMERYWYIRQPLHRIYPSRSSCQ